MNYKNWFRPPWTLAGRRDQHVGIGVVVILLASLVLWLLAMARR